MKDTPPLSKEQRLEELKAQLKKLYGELAKAEKSAVADEVITVRLNESKAHFQRVRNSDGPDIGIGDFFILLDITAVRETVYIPSSVASGKKPTGFVYQIEGTAEGTISTTKISCKGEGVTQIKLGTLLYSKVPKGVTATFRIEIEIRGRLGKEYKIIISRIHYKRDPSDARYQKYVPEIKSKVLKFN